MRLWLATGVVRPETWQRYEQYARLHSVPMLGHRPLSKIGAADLQLLYADRVAPGCSPTSVRHLHRGLHGDRLSALYVLALTTGMRQGELLALRWTDLDLPGGGWRCEAACATTRAAAGP